MTGEPRPGGPKFAAFAKEILDAESARKMSLEQRGATIIATSATLVSLLFGLTALVTRANDYVLPEAARHRLLWAACFFVAAALLAITTNIPLSYRVTDPEDVRLALKDRFEDPEKVAEQLLGGTRLTLAARAQRLNGFKAWCLAAAFVAQVVAVALVAWAVARILE